MARATTTKKQTSIKQKITSGVIAVDNGGYNTKVFAEGMDAPISFSSKKAYGHDNKLTVYDEKSMKIEWNDEIYFTGILMLDSRSHLTGYTDSKATDYFILNTLLAVALYGFEDNLLITTVPYSRYNDEEIEAITGRLQGEHTLIINDQEYNFEISEVEIGSEAMLACHAVETEGLVRWLDLGSRTVGYASSFFDETYHPLTSMTGTIEGEGLDIRNIPKTKEEFKRYVGHFIPELIRMNWDYNDSIIAFGGGALHDELIEVLQEKFPNLKVADDPLHLQVLGMYTFAVNYVWVEDDVNE